MATLYDMHVHTTSSPDSDLGGEELVELALEDNLAGVGVVAHVDAHPEDYCSNSFEPEVYDAETNSTRRTAERGGIQILKGVELGEPHRFGGQYVELMRGRSYDFVTGALHWVDDNLVLEADCFRSGDRLEIIEEYYRQTLEIVECCDLDVLAHPGMFRRGLARAGLGHDLDETELWPDLLAEVLQAMIDRGIAMEVNTSGLRKKEDLIYPGAPLLKLYREMGGSLVVLGSDTHSGEKAFIGLEKGRKMLEDCGFESASYYRARVAVPYLI
ncbi:hypothetical protein GF402_10495 [Candidatus Fermentibacteria bacterium]|nr:hypothetical protein [Candidatus Fermentibacteria bacterium]